jgi:probable F420-dependent oxidoreductase
MEFGVYVPNCHHGVGLDVYTAGRPFPPGLAINPNTFVQMAKAADELGFGAIWTGDHIFFPPHTVSPHKNSGHNEGADIRVEEPVFDPLVTLTYLAGITTKVKLAVSVLVIPYRNPVLTAKWLASLDVLSNGRVRLGIGTGWLKEEFEAVAAPFEARGAVTDEYIKVMRTLWENEDSFYEGEHYHLNSGMVFNPKPIQKPLPIWGGGNTPRGLRRAARLGNGWIGSYMPHDEVAAKFQTLRGLLEEQGRDPDDFTYGHHARLYVYEEPYPDAPPCIGLPAKIIEDIKRFEEVGVQHLELAPPPGPTTEAILNQMYRFADEVLPHVRVAVTTA